MKQNINKELEKNLELLKRVTDKGQSIILQQYQQLKDKEIETFTDFEKRITNINTIIKYIKRVQMLIRKRIQLLNLKGNEEKGIKVLERTYQGLEETKSLLNPTLDFLTLNYDIFKYEPEKLDEPGLLGKLNQEYVELLSRWIEYLEKQYELV
jgi:hypothetical protein